MGIQHFALSCLQLLNALSFGDKSFVFPFVMDGQVSRGKLLAEVLGIKPSLLTSPLIHYIMMYGRRNMPLML